MNWAFKLLERDDDFALFIRGLFYHNEKCKYCFYFVLFFFKLIFWRSQTFETNFFLIVWKNKNIHNVSIVTSQQLKVRETYIKPLIVIKTIFDLDPSFPKKLITLVVCHTTLLRYFCPTTLKKVFFFLNYCSMNILFEKKIVYKEI